MKKIISIAISCMVMTIAWMQSLLSLTLKKGLQVSNISNTFITRHSFVLCYTFYMLVQT